MGTRKNRSKGFYTVELSSVGLPEGICVYSLQAGGVNIAKRMLVLK